MPSRKQMKRFTEDLYQMMHDRLPPNIPFVYFLEKPEETYLNGKPKHKNRIYMVIAMVIEPEKHVPEVEELPDIIKRLEKFRAQHPPRYIPD